MNLRRTAIPWESNASGATDVDLTAAGVDLAGRIDRIITVPDATDVPTDNYDIVIADRLGNDVLGGAGANRDTANTETAWVSTALVYHWLDSRAHGPFRMQVRNAGAAKRGTLVLYVLVAD